MKNDGWIGKRGLRYWYYRYRDSEYYALSTVILTLVACIFLLFNVIIPEVTQWFSIRDEVVATQLRITTLQKNINFMNNLNKGIVDQELQTVSQALPPEKNFTLILQAVSNAAINSGVSLGDYTFTVGAVSAAAGAQVASGSNPMSITVNVTGSFDQVRRFVSAIETSLPIAEVTKIDGTGQTSSITIQFYQKPFPSLNLTGDEPLTELSVDKVDLLHKLSTWQSATSSDNNAQPVSSDSAVPLF